MITKFLQILLGLWLGTAVAQNVTISCKTVLGKSSSQWIQSQPEPIDATQIYSDCYKRKLDGIYQTLNDVGNPPPDGSIC